MSAGTIVAYFAPASQNPAADPVAADYLQALEISDTSATDNEKQQVVDCMCCLFG